MKIPLVLDIATKNVIYVESKQSVNDAISLMAHNNHRNVIVVGNNKFFVITANDIVRLKLEDYNFNLPLSSVTLDETATILSDKSILDALELVQQSHEYICVVDKRNKLLGLLTNTDVITSIDPETLMENYRVGDLMRINAKMVKADKDTPVKDVLNNFLNKDNDCVIVIDEFSKPAGILTTKDAIRILNINEGLDKRLEEHMTSPVLSIREDATIKDAITFVKKRDFNRVVVTDVNGVLVGMISQKDLISLSYNKWATFVRNYQTELKEINDTLKDKADKYQEMAFTDNLTGLYNRYKLLELFEAESRTASRKNSNMALAVVDIDNFKQVNDAYGHTIGDHVLIKISNLLLACLRSTDIVARWGGEEFVLLLICTPQENSDEILERVREKIEQYKFEINKTITISIGQTAVEIGEEFDEAFKRADSALYISKMNGKNQVTII